jgi:two-component sensor histidine kinase
LGYIPRPAADSKLRAPIRGFLAAYDLPAHFGRYMSLRATQTLTVLACTALAVLTREAVDLALPGAGPFALTMPFVLFATLFARWEAGVATLALLLAFAWYYVLPSSRSFAFEVATDGPRVVVNATAGLLVVGLGEYFRRRVQTTLEERDRIAADRLLLLNELDHRVKNNFAMVSAIVRMESRQAQSEELVRVLDRVGGRVESIARAHEALYRGDDGVGEVRMRNYLRSLCRSLESGMFRSLNVALHVDVDDVGLQRDRAIAVGLIVNELCTNAAKHAFAGRNSGEMNIRLARDGTGLRVTVEDDGIGLSRERSSRKQVGGKLVGAFAQQAGGEIVTVPTEVGTKFELLLADVASKEADLA